MMLKIILWYETTYILTEIDTYKIDGNGQVIQKLGLVLSNLGTYETSDYKNLNIYFTVDNEVYLDYDNEITKFDLPFDEIICFNEEIVWSYDNYYYSHSVENLENINTNYTKENTQYDKIKLNEEWIYSEKDGLKLLNHSIIGNYHAHSRFLNLNYLRAEDNMRFIKFEEDVTDLVYIRDYNYELSYTLIYYENKIELLYNYNKNIFIDINYKIEGCINDNLLLEKDNKHYILDTCKKLIKDMNYQSLYRLNFEVKNKKLFIDNKEATIYEFIELLKNNNNNRLVYLNIDDFDFDKQDIQKLIFYVDRLFIVKQNTLYEYNKNGEIIHYDVKFPIKIKKSSN